MGELIDINERRNALRALPEMGPEYAEDVGGPWTAEDYERRLQAMAHRLRMAMEALSIWEEWEATWIKDEVAWCAADGLPKLTQALFDELVSVLQPLRNRALYHKSPSAY